MDVVSFSGFVDAAVGQLGALSEQARDMDGRAAFLLGMLAWFTVEQAVRRLAGLLRWAILAAMLAGGGFAALSVLGLVPPADEEPARHLQVPPARS